MIEDNVLLSIVHKCTRLVKERHGLDLDINALPTDDVGVYELIKKDKSNDVFGLDSTECNARMSLLQPTDFRHIRDFHAMEHPYMSVKFSEYIRNKNNPAIIEYHTYAAETVLAETYGVVLYRDQIERIIHSISGIPDDVSANIARYIRQCMTPEVSLWKPVFIVGAHKKGCSEERAEFLWNWIKTEGEFVSYRMTAECRALTTYRCFWLKACYPNEYKDALTQVINSTK